MSQPANLDKPALHVRHSELSRCDSLSDKRSDCPACEAGILSMERDPHNGFRLLREDRCLSCKQLVIYQDHSVGGEVLFPVLGAEA